MKYFTKEVKIGLTGIAALIILYLGINFLKGVSMSPTHSYYITFTNAHGLARSSAVYADGYQIGIVRDISYDFDKPGTIVVEVTVDDDVRIPVGTKAVLNEAMLGGCTLNLTLGTNPKEEIPAGDTIVGTEDMGLTMQAAELMPKVYTVLEHVDSLITTLNKITSDPSIQGTVNNAEQLTANLNNGAAQLNNLLNKDVPHLIATLDQAGQNTVRLTDNLSQLDLQPTITQVNRTIDDVQELIRMMQDPNGNLGLLLSDTAVYSNLNTTINSANELLLDMKRRPNRYVHFSVFGKSAKE